MDTKVIAERLFQKFGTRNPFDLAESLGIVIFYEPLRDIQGYYNKCYRQQFIHINQALCDNESTFTCAHELGHAILHPDVNTPFLRKHTMLSVNKLEMQANYFAVDLIYDDFELRDCLSWPVSDTAAYMGIPVNLAEYRMRSVLIR